jgi:predicted MFS family arabinose efflux permease
MEEVEPKRERLYVFILAAIQVVHILDFVVMMPLGPRFMRVFNISPIEFSTLVSAYTFSAGGVGFFGALYADQFDRKRFLLFNFMGFIIGTLMCGLATNFATLLIARIVAGAFGGVLNASVLSMVADLIPYKRRGAAMGVIMSAFSVSSIIGIPTGLYIANILDWHATFFFICLVSAIFWILGFMTLPSIPAVKTKGFMEKLRKFKKIIVNPDYLLTFFFSSLLSLGMFMIIPFISTYMVRNIGIQESDLSLLYLVGGLITIVTARYVGKLCDRLGAFKIFKIMALISLIPITILTHLPPVSLFVVILVSSAFTVLGNARFIPAMTMVSGVVKTEDRGTFMSLENASRQLSSALAAQIGGVILGSTAAGALTNFDVIGYLCVSATFGSLLIAYKLRTKIGINA